MRNRSTKPTGSSYRLAAAQVALLGLAAFSAPVSAFQPLITDDTGTQGSGGNQLEFSLNEGRAKTAGGVERLHSLPLVYTRGLSDTLDVFAGFSYVRIRSGAPADDASGGGNPSFGAKWRFYESGESKTSLAVKPEVLLPLSADSENDGLGNGRTSGNLTFILTQEVAFGAIHINAGVGRERYRDTLNNPDTSTTRASIAPVWDLTEQWKLALDLGTESSRAAGARMRSNFVELGAIYSPSKDLDFALGILRTTDNDSPGTTTRTATAGVTWRFR
ncbi:MAG: transporter [Burkholderiales bacterium]